MSSSRPALFRSVRGRRGPGDGLAFICRPRRARRTSERASGGSGGRTGGRYGRPGGQTAGMGGLAGGRMAVGYSLRCWRAQQATPRRYALTPSRLTQPIDGGVRSPPPLFPSPIPPPCFLRRERRPCLPTVAADRVDETGHALNLVAITRFTLQPPAAVAAHPAPFAAPPASVAVPPASIAGPPATVAAPPARCGPAGPRCGPADIRSGPAGPRCGPADHRGGPC